MNLQAGKMRIGVYVCQCGTNIAGKVDVEKVVHFAEHLDDVVVARNYTYMCSDPGQAIIKEDIQKENLDRVVVASCTPLMHEGTFRKACAEAGLNPFLFQMTNIREHVAWVTEDPDTATEKTKALVAGCRQACPLAGPAGEPPGSLATIRAGGRRRDRGDRSGLAARRCRETGLPGGARAFHRRAHGSPV
jgi:hypothetical protein